jgi:hypothetical protein
MTTFKEPLYVDTSNDAGDGNYSTSFAVVNQTFQTRGDLTVSADVTTHNRVGDANGRGRFGTQLTVTSAQTSASFTLPASARNIDFQVYVRGTQTCQLNFGVSADSATPKQYGVLSLSAAGVYNVSQWQTVSASLLAGEAGPNGQLVRVTTSGNPAALFSRIAISYDI